MKAAQSVQQLQPSYIREILADANKKGVISLAGGLPAAQSVPLGLMAVSLAGLSERADLFQYGQTAGYGPLVDLLKLNYQLDIRSDLLISTGAQQGLDLIARGFIEKGDTVVVEEPAYLGALQVFALAQADLQTVAQTTSGPDLEQLQKLFATGKVKLFYAVPDFHNPTGVCWPLAGRKQVAQMCQTYQVTLVEDAPYRDLRFTGEPQPMVSSFCVEHALVLHSFSKTAAPGMRLGCVHGPSPWINTLIRVKQGADLHSSLPMQAVLFDLLSHKKYPEHLNAVVGLYHHRMHAMTQAIKRHCKQGLDCQFTPVEGGMFIWLKLNKGNAMDIAIQSLKNGVAVVPSNVFYAPKSTGYSGAANTTKTHGPALRLNFSHACERDIDQGIKRLATFIT